MPIFFRDCVSLSCTTKCRLSFYILTMPGLPKVPAAEKIDVDENGRITGLF